MTATLHRIGAGDGYRYYTAMTASADEPRAKGESMADYYARSGNPAGQWMGQGTADLGVNGEVAERQLQNLLGLGLHPDTGAQLGQRYRIYATVQERISARLERMPQATVEQVAAVTAEEERKGERQAVAGFDATFSPVKSVSVAWGLASPEVARQLEAAHDAAVASTVEWVEWIEREAVTARAGADGVAHVDVGGVSAAAFTHRTSRAGDPDLHTHVVISNKVLARTPDGQQKWLTLDSRGLYKANVTFSERYNRVLEDEISRRLGWQFAPRSDQPADALAPIRELTNVPEPLITAFSQRRQQIEADYAQRVAAYRAEHGHEPPKNVQYEIAQAATLANRPPKEAGSTEAGERAAWQRVAGDILNDSERQQLASDLAPAGAGATRERLSDDEVRGYAEAVIAQLQERRSDWTDRHVAAAAQRITADARLGSSAHRDAMIGQIIEATHGLDDVLAVSAPERVTSPDELRRVDGTPVWEAPASRRSSTYTLLAAEGRLQDAAREHAPAAIIESSMNLVLSDHRLAPDQLSAVRQLASGDRRVQLLVGPAGTGKTTTMRALCDVWQRAGGAPVRGLAPTAAAASVLRTETGMDHASTIDYWATLRQAGSPAARFGAGELVIVDESGMAGTMNLDRVVSAAREDGAHVVLVGDPKQLAAVASGGALRLIQRDVGAVELSTVWRFADRDPVTGERVLRQWEAEASLALREGDPEAIEAYIEHERVHHGARDALSDDIYSAWLRDQGEGLESVMIATDNATVQNLSERARADRVAAGLVDDTRTVTLRNGSQVGVGDIIVTRTNDRSLRVGGDFVKNGDLWTVTGMSAAGDLEVTGQHGRCVLPRSYVDATVELGYSMTAHRAQGLTVDRVHTLVDDSLSREVLSVAATRGRAENHLYVVSDHLLDVDLDHPSELDQPARAVLRAVLENSEAAISATEAILAEDELAASVATQLARWRYVRESEDPEGRVLDSVLRPEAAQQLRADASWPYLRQVLHWRAVTPAQLRDAVQQRSLAGADSVARVLAARLEQSAAAEHGGDWMPAPSGDPYADALLEAARERASELGARVAAERPAWSEALGPVPEDERAQWHERAGNIAAYREAHAITDPVDPLGRAPREPHDRVLHQQLAGEIEHCTADRQRPAAAAGLDDQQLREQLEATRRQRDAIARALQRATETAQQDQRPGPRTQEIDQDVQAWTASVDRLDRAEASEAQAAAAEQRADEASRAFAAHQAQQPGRRERGEWEQISAQLHDERERANTEAIELGIETDRAARGLPPREQWDQVRRHAETGLAGAPQDRMEAVQADERDREQARVDAPQLRAQHERLTAAYESLRAEHEGRHQPDVEVAAIPTSQAEVEETQLHETPEAELEH